MKYDEAFEDRFTLSDGGSVLLRLVRPEDAPAFIDGLAKCSPRTIYNRFMGTKPRFSVAEIRYLTEVDTDHHLAIVGFVGDELAVVGRAIRYKHRPDAADFGIIVRDEFQKNGLGRYVLDLLIEAMAERGIVYMCGEMFATNSAMFRVIDDLPYVADWILDGAMASFEVDLSSRK